MPIAPPRRISKTRKRKRRTHYKIEVPGMTLCPNCGEMKLSHYVCKSCGFYGGKHVLNTESKQEEQPVEETKKTSKKTEAVEAKKAPKKAAKKVEVDEAVEPKKTTRKTTKKTEKAE